MASDAYNFPLAWRWTQPSHNVLPPEVMAEIRPLAQVSAPNGTFGLTVLDPAVFEDIRVVSADVPVMEGKDWLVRLPVELHGRITVCWDESTAVETTWEIFTRYWDDFCYPGSDDVMVFPASAAWLFVYHHEEAFMWGDRRRR